MFPASWPVVASVVQKLDARAWANTLHGAFLGGLFLALTVAALLLVLQLRTRDLTAEGARITLRLAQAACVALVVTGWLAAVSGTFVVDHWFRSATPTSPSTVLEASGYGAWVTAEHAKELLAWLSVAAGTAAAYLALRDGKMLAVGGKARLSVGVLLLAALAFGSVAGVLGVLLTKLAPLS
jgi:hypothetical protein